MSKTVYVIKTPSGYLAPSDMLRAWVKEAKDALTFLSHIHAGIVAKKYGGQVETLTLTSDGS